MIITVNNISVKCKQLPFSNKFTARKVRIVQDAGVDEIHLRALCTSDSKEPGRVYACAYSLQGDLLACNTLN